MKVMDEGEAVHALGSSRAGFVPPERQSELWDGVCALSTTLVFQEHILDTAVGPKTSGQSSV